MDRLSALMDGELDDREAQGVIVRLKDDSELRIRWDDFHLVRDALRGEPMLSSRFNERLSQRLADEPTVLAPRRLLPRSRRAMTYTMSAAASIAAAALVVTVAMPQLGGSDNTKDVAANSPAPVPVSGPQPTPVSAPYDRQMNQYLFLHEGVSPAAALQGLAPYIRTTVETTGSADRR